MKNKIFLLISLVAGIAVLSNCKKDGTEAKITNSALPVITSLPNLTLQAANSTDTLTFSCTPFNPGFAVQTTYTLQADSSGRNFSAPVTIYTGTSIGNVKIVESKLNTLLSSLSKVKTSFAVDFRIKAVLTLQTDAASASVTKPQYFSTVKTASITVY